MATNLSASTPGSATATPCSTTFARKVQNRSARGFDHGGWFGEPVAFPAPSSMPSTWRRTPWLTAPRKPWQRPLGAGGDDSAAVEGVDFSGTNVEVGVDEADIIKTDGDRVYLVAADQLVVVDDGGRVVLGSVDLPDVTPASCFFRATTSCSSGRDGRRRAVSLTPATPKPALPTGMMIEPGSFNTSVVQSSPCRSTVTAPPIDRTMVVEGDYVSLDQWMGLLGDHPRQPQYPSPSSTPRTKPVRTLLASQPGRDRVYRS